MCTTLAEQLTAHDLRSDAGKAALQICAKGIAQLAELGMNQTEQREKVAVGVQHTIAQVEIVPSRFGIPQYKALLGAIALQDRVVVRVEILEELAKLEAKSSSAEATSFGPA